MKSYLQTSSLLLREICQNQPVPLFKDICSNSLKVKLLKTQ